MQCIQCKRPFDLEKDRIVSISGSIMGDENIETYFLCPVCDVYTLTIYWDSFTGGEAERLLGPLARQEGDEKVALIQRCPKPWSKRCRCDAHRKYFNDSLD